MNIELKRIKAKLYELSEHTFITNLGPVVFKYHNEEPLCDIIVAAYFTEDNKFMGFHKNSRSDAVYIRDNYTECLVTSDYGDVTVYSYHDVLYTDMFELPDGSRYLRKPLLN